MTGRLRTRVVTPESWPDVERLFGTNGACGGCWCMYWRTKRGEDWDAVKGAPARRRLKHLLENEGAIGILAYEEDSPIGWTTLGPKTMFDRVERAPSLRTPDGETAWCIPCFFIERQHRGQGVAKTLLKAAERLARARGAPALEGYPIQPQGSRVPGAFAFTGVPSLFESAGFERIVERERGKLVMRKTF